MIEKLAPLPKPPFNQEAWTKAFAWWPVYVDAYRAAEIRHGKMRYIVWLKHVEWCEYSYITEDGLQSVRRYRLAQ